MNSLYEMTGNSLPRNQPATMSQLMQFIKTTTPQQARAQVEQILKEKQVSSAEFETIKQQAKEIASSLGI